MNAHSYLRLALAAPVVLPGLVILGHLAFSGGNSPVAAVLAYQLAYGAPGYVLFVPVALFLARGRSPHQLRRLALLLPLVFIPFCAVSFWFSSVLMGISIESVTLLAFVRFLPFIALYSIVFGYAYVLIALVGFIFIGRGGSAQPSVPPDVPAAASRRQGRG